MGKGSGKGEGRGGCIDAMLEAARQAVACAYCLCCCWGVMFFIAIYMLFTPSTRPEQVQKYNKAVEAWTSTGYKNFKKTSPAKITPAGTYSATSTPSELKDNGDDVKSYSDYLKYVRSGMKPDPKSKDWGNTIFAYGSKSLEAKSVQTVYKTTKHRKKQKSGYEKCPSGTTTTDSSGKFYTSSGMYCTARFLLKKYCVIAKVSDDGTLSPQDAGLNGCYPTTDQTANKWAGLPSTDGTTFALYESVAITSTTDPTTTVEFRSQTDPYLVALQITKGTLDFGLTKGQMLTISLVLFIICGVMCIPCCILGYVVCHPSRRETMMGRARYGNQWTPTSNNTSYQPMVDHQYGGQQPPPQQPYGQPPPHQQPYGQPPPQQQPYGQPPPQQPYGQPPPQQGGYPDMSGQQPQQGFPVYPGTAPPSAPPAPGGYQPAPQAYPEPIKP